MSEAINNHSRRQEALKRMIAQLHAGKSVDEVKSQFAALLAEVDATEIAMLEQALIAQGMPAMEIKRLCDVHVAAFEEALNARARAEAGSRPDSQPDAVIGQLKAENVAAARALDALEAAIRSGQWEQARARLATLREHEKHYLRKENMLFPYLEKHGFSGPSTVMWAIHDDIRAGWKQLDVVLAGSPDAVRVAAVFAPLADAIRQMFYKEESILFPAALQALTPQEWAAIAAGESATGAGYAKAEATKPVPAASRTESQAGTSRLIPLQVGALTVQQIALLLTHLPVDVTYVDENDEVRFYSATKERIFDRQPAIIGRKVQQCHPPTSIHRVQRILDDFHSGRRDTAEFWIQMGGPESQGGKFIHIRYFALRDEPGNYRGALEVTQDITAIRKLEGERRLLAEGG
jgi:DUF438 domain-containing protein